MNLSEWLVLGFKALDLSVALLASAILLALALTT
jgi:hypothetical protein